LSKTLKLFSVYLLTCKSPYTFLSLLILVKISDLCAYLGLCVYFLNRKLHPCALIWDCSSIRHSRVQFLCPLKWNCHKIFHKNKYKVTQQLAWILSLLLVLVTSSKFFSGETFKCCYKKWSNTSDGIFLFWISQYQFL